LTNRSYVSICSGAGLGSHGVDKAGWTGSAFVEFDPTRRAVLRRWHPEAELFEGINGDLERLSGTDIPEAYAWIVTVPCTDFSIAGRRKGVIGKAGRLHVDFFRVLKQTIQAGKAPEVVVWEQAPGWMSHGFKWPHCHGGDGVVTVYRWTKEELGRLGYTAVMGGPMNAWAFGVPQDRTRCFLVFARDKHLLPKEIRPPLFDDPRLLERTLIREWPERYIAKEVELSGRPEIQRRVAQFRKDLEKRERLAGEIPAFAGVIPPLPEWDGLVVFMSLKNASSVHAGYAQTITKDPRLLARLPDGRIVECKPEALEFLMGVPEGYTEWGIGEHGQEVFPRVEEREDACGDGIVSPIMESIARSLTWVGQEKKR